MNYIYKPGTVVTLGIDGTAIITEVLIKKGSVSYKVAWWDGTTRNCQWVEDFEISTKAPKTEIGFKCAD